MRHDSHLPIETLLMAADGELSLREQVQVEAHLAACWACRSRKQEMEAAIGSFVRFHRESFHDWLPSQEGPRALLLAQLRQMEENDNSFRRWLRFPRRRLIGSVLWVSAAMLAAALLPWRQWTHRTTAQVIALAVPNHSLTPGAIIALDRREVCGQTTTKNKQVPQALQREVFAEYGISSTHPEAYEVDYLITPALGGADDIHNLWPESKRTAGWNALVKDALEDHLRDLVCTGQLDLTTAQHEIASNWIDAYKKYFQTNRPLIESR